MEIETSYSKKDIAMDEKLEDLSVKLAEKLTELKDLDSQIETSLDELEYEIIESQEYQGKGILWRGRLQRLMNQHTGNHVAIATQNETSNNRTVPETKVTSLQMSAFYGDSSQWFDFWNV
ncbi:hypothetical protein AVEN_53755-1 [Araneus ventricosus]|uniref:Uncharacterized protein n=1 Tax=Araneus ventricosus TaxID=182803 RepID=A0A4Y2MYU3_ARAVE|nr:hypothetical protein AVEN_53755-1 [Araneus ventricosus]